MRIFFDVDDTVMFQDKPSDYQICKPIVGMKNYVNAMFDDGHEIYFYTARGMGRYNNDADLAIGHFYDLTWKQLTEFGFKFHGLILGKPNYDVLVDDKAYNPDCPTCKRNLNHKVLNYG